MEGFTDFDSIYNHLDDNALNFKYEHVPGDLFKSLRDLMIKENKKEEAEKAQWEIDFFYFVIKDDEIKLAFSTTNKKGEIEEWPNLKNFNERTYEYLVFRLDNTNNPLLKARYSHILWHSPKKHGKYAKIAIDSYLELIKIFEEKDIKESHGIEIINFIINAYKLANKINYKKEEVKSEIKRLINNFNFNSESSFVLRLSLIKLMLNEKKSFTKEDFKDLDKICLKVSEFLINVGNIHASIDMFELIIKISQQLGIDTKNYIKRIAESYEIMMIDAEKTKNLAYLDFCQLALENYKKIDDEKKIKELEKKYFELKNSIELSQFSTEIDLSEIIKKYKSFAKEIVQNSSENIITFLILDKSLLPTYKKMEEISKEINQKTPFQYLSSSTILDLRGNIAQHFTEEEERKYRSILNNYNFELMYNRIFLIKEIFFEAIKEGKLSSDILLRFFNENSWFGKNIKKRLPNNMEFVTNWLNLIAPSIHDFFITMNFCFLNPKIYPNLVLCIDSLVLKIEGLIRDICEFSGVTTFYQTKDNRGRNITREKNIHHLLYEDKIKDLFDEDDLLFFRFLLVEQAGFNLRHKIAHSFMLFEQYAVEYMFLLIILLLKLGKYDFATKEDLNSQSISQN